jgi:hypothetical protein
MGAYYACAPAPYWGPMPYAPYAGFAYGPHGSAAVWGPGVVEAVPWGVPEGGRATAEGPWGAPPPGKDSGAAEASADSSRAAADSDGVKAGAVVAEIVAGKPLNAIEENPMNQSLTPLGHGIISLILLASVLCFPSLSTGGEIAKKITGEVKVQSQTDASQQPIAPPSAIFVQDFDLGCDTSRQDPVEKERLPGRILSRFSHRNDTEQLARKLVGIMTSTLIKGFSENGIHAGQLITGTPFPTEGWLVRGVFTEVGEGKRLVRAAIGFGAGATKMEVYVTVSNLAEDPDAPFIIFGTEKEPKKIPGAVVTRNPYVAAAKFVMEKNASEKDAKKTASQIVETLVNYIKTLGKKNGTGEPPPDAR